MPPIENKEYSSGVNLNQDQDYFHVYWLSWEGGTLRSDSYSDIISHEAIMKTKPASPPRSDDADYYYTFSSWSRSDYGQYVKYKAVYNQYPLYKWKKYKTQQTTIYKWNKHNFTTDNIVETLMEQHNLPWRVFINGPYAYNTSTILVYNCKLGLSNYFSTHTGEMNNWGGYYLPGATVYADGNGHHYTTVFPPCDHIYLQEYRNNAYCDYKLTLAPKSSSVIGTLTSTSSSAYVKNDISNGYYYEYLGSSIQESAGTFIADISSKSSNTYPTNGKHTDGYWYIMQ